MRLFKKYSIQILTLVIIFLCNENLLSRIVERRPLPPRPTEATPMSPPAGRQFIPEVAPRLPDSPQSIAVPIINKPEKFTQTEGYLQHPNLKRAVVNTFKGDFEVVKHMDIVSRVFAKEAEHRNTHWAFYHGVSNVWTVWQDTYTELFNHFHPEAEKDTDDFIFLRTKGKGKTTAKNFLVESLREHGLVDDNGEQKALLLSTNLFLFGNTAISGESTWKYMLTDKTHERPSAELYQSIMDEFGLPYDHIEELIQLTDLLQSKQQTLLQIFVPKNIVDDIGYLAWTRGIPADDPTINWIRKSGIRGKRGQSGAVRAIGILIEKFKKEQERNPLFRDMLKTIEEGGYSIDDFLTRCCNDPLSVPNMDDVQARLIFTDDILLNPGAGVKMYRYGGVDYRKQSEYRNRLNAIIQKIIASKK